MSYGYQAPMMNGYDPIHRGGTIDFAAQRAAEEARVAARAAAEGRSVESQKAHEKAEALAAHEAEKARHEAAVAAKLAANEGRWQEITPAQERDVAFLAAYAKAAQQKGFAGARVSSDDTAISALWRQAGNVNFVGAVLAGPTEIYELVQFGQRLSVCRV